MKRNLIFLESFLAVFLLLLGCARDDESIATQRTVIKGRVYDVARGININGATLIFKQTMDCSKPGSCGFINIKELDTLKTDENGSYYGEYDLVEGQYIMEPQDFNGNPYFGEPITTDSIKLGKVNTIDFDAFYPVILKIDLKLINNKNPPLQIRNEITEYRSYLIFPSESLWEENTEQIIYLQTRPNTEIEIEFSYSTGNTNADFHSTIEALKTNSQDTVAINYSIDCSKF